MGAEWLKSDVNDDHSIVAAQACRIGVAKALWLAWLVGVALAGCAPLAPVLDGTENLLFRVEGKISVRGSGGAVSASFVWWQRSDSYEIEFWGPLGSQRTRIQGDEGSFAIVDAGGERIAGADPELLMQRELGWSVPVAVLSHWIQGAPAPTSPWAVASHDETGSLAAFEQGGWYVEVLARNSEALPTRVRAERGSDRIVVACRNWSFGT